MASAVGKSAVALDAGIINDRYRRRFRKIHQSF